jgi:hypothetical protein
MPATTRRKFTPMLLVFRNFNSHLVVCRLAGHQEKGGARTFGAKSGAFSKAMAWHPVG